MTSDPQAAFDLQALDQMTGGAFSATTASARSQCLRQWLQSDPALPALQEVFREMATRDKGAAKVLRERMDELRRAREQEGLANDWAARAQQLLDLPRMNIADAMAWQRDAAKAGAPLSREPLAGLKQQLAEVVRRVEELQHQAMVLRESAVLLAQRIEVLSTKPLAEAQAAHAGVMADAQAWLDQAQALVEDPRWPSVDLRHPPQIDAARAQLQAVSTAFVAALQAAEQALADPQAPLPAVPVWAEDVRSARAGAPGAGAAPTVAAADAPAAAKPPRPDAAQRQALREQATQAVLQVLEAVEKEVAEGHGKGSAEGAQALRQVLKTHGRHLDPALDARVHQALTAAGELEGWQRWRADQIRQELLGRAQALLGEDGQPTLGGRKMQEALRQLREAWKATDQGGLPNHSLWKKFDGACNKAYETVQAWLQRVKQETAAQKGLRQQLIEEVQAWTQAHAQDSDWRAQARAVHQFAERWRNAGHLNEKAYAELQPQWKATIHAAAARLEAEQKLSLQRRHALIEEARGLAQAPTLRVDAVKALQQRWQAEAQAVPLDRKTEQKLWEAFRQPIDEAFARKPAGRHSPSAPLSPRDQAVFEAAQALKQASAQGDASRIRAAEQALEAALNAAAQAPAAPVASAAAAPQAQADAVPEGPDQADATPAETNADAPVAPPTVPRPPKPLVAVRGDDRPGQKKSTPLPSSGRREPAGARAGRFGRDDGREARERSGPRLGDAAFRALREAREQADQALRRLSSQAHGEALGRLCAAWAARDATQLPSAQELGAALPNGARPLWAQALSTMAQPSDGGAVALLRLEMAADCPTPAAQLSARRALQLQLLTRRNDPSPQQTWAQDVAQVLATAHEAGAERRLQTALRQLLKR